MFDLLFLVFLAPMIGFLLLAFGRDRWSENAAAAIGVGSVGISALVTAGCVFQFMTSPPEGGVFTQHLWTWISVGNFTPEFALRLDGLSLTMISVICGVGFLIHLFASWYMREDPGYGRFFSYMNLFVMSMVFLVLGDNLLFLYLGWEGVGLASYLLIGFWYSDSANGLAARKAFVVTRVGDTFMAIALFLLFRDLGTLDIQQILTAAPAFYADKPAAITTIALLMLGGAVGKSAQLPLQTWLPDAMAGPTPVSALIHAATMVTAGVYLIARTHTLFELSPFALDMVGLTGAVTLLIAGFTAMVQTDIKRVLAYSTMSQIGYMFLALGAGAWSAAIFHLMTHAFFKALLFLASGAVILGCHHEQNIFHMGGLRKKLPLAFWSFVIGGSALAALPYLTAGFYSKDEILIGAWAGGHQGLFYAALFGAFLTSIYTSRLIFITFFGKYHGHADVHAGHGISYNLPLMVLIVLSTLVGGFIHPPVEAVLPATHHAEHSVHTNIALVSGAVALLGVAIGYALFFGERRFVTNLGKNPTAAMIAKFWYSAFGFDWLYDKLFVKPFTGLVHLLRKDTFDVAVMSVTSPLTALNGVFSRTQNGQIRWYAASLAGGAVLIIALVVLS